VGTLYALEVMKKVFVALSGGVDSAVAAHILKREGWMVTGVFIRVWQPDFLACNQDDEERAAKRVAAYLGIPFLRLDLAAEYKTAVVDAMINEYMRGRTPNPDVLCNAEIKFGAFLDFAKEHGAEKIATGHHAQVIGGKLHRGCDPKKDQGYFLWKLTQEELSHTLMPIGHMKKEEVRAYAEQYAIPSAHKPDSQGLCFIGQVDMKEFLKHYITTSKGAVLNEEGDSIGEHDGSEFITLGQRSGFCLHNANANRKVHYVISKNTEQNSIVVSTNPNDSQEMKEAIPLTDTNWNQEVRDRDLTCEVRYHGERIACTIKNDVVHMQIPQLVAPGQSIVVYAGTECIGGGVVA